MELKDFPDEFRREEGRRKDRRDPRDAARGERLRHKDEDHIAHLLLAGNQRVLRQALDRCPASFF